GVGYHLAPNYVSGSDVKTGYGRSAPVAGPERRAVRVERCAEPAMIAGLRIVSGNEVAGSIQADNHAKVGDQHSAAGKQRELLRAVDRVRERSNVEVRHLRVAADVEPFHIGALRCVIHRALVGIENNVIRSAIFNERIILGEQIARGIELKDLAAAIGLADVGVAASVKYDGCRIAIVAGSEQS